MYGKTINAYSRQSYLKRVHRLVSIHIYNIHMVRMVGVGNLFVFWLIVVHLILIKCGDRIADLLYMMHICIIFFLLAICYCKMYEGGWIADSALIVDEVRTSPKRRYSSLWFSCVLLFVLLMV